MTRHANDPLPLSRSLKPWRWLTALAAGLALLIPTLATAQTTTSTTQTTTTTSSSTSGEVVTPASAAEQHRWFDTQIALTLGGGYASFVSGAFSDMTSGGGAWDLRLLVGAHSPIGVELGYIGAANSIKSLDATLTTTAFEGDLRLGTPPWIGMPLQLYGFIGAGLNRFDVLVGNTSSFNFSKVDTTFVMPFGGGVQFNLSPHVLLDGRFTYRMMFDEHLIGRNDNTDMYTVTARLGFVF